MFLDLGWGLYNDWPAGGSRASWGEGGHPHAQEVPGWWLGWTAGKLSGKTRFQKSPFYSKRTALDQHQEVRRCLGLAWDPGLVS